MNQNSMGLLLGIVSETIKVLNEEAGRVDLGTQTVITFLSVAQAGEMPQSQLGKLTGMTHAGVSRNVARLAHYGDRYGDGLGLIQSVEDEQDRKSRILSLTPKGKAVLAEIQKRAGKYLDMAVRRELERK